jgi:NitT/TauT family transport system ATP-binding protein
MDELLQVEALDKRFTGAKGTEPAPWVIKNLNFSIQEGEFVTLVGPSGAGKSTVLSMLAQVEPACGGKIRLRGKVVFDADNPVLHPGLNRQIGYVTQDDNLLPWRTLIDNVLFPLEIQHALTEAARQRARDLLDVVGLTGYEQYFPHQLSGGMRKRAALIRTMVYDPPIILMDEPFGALDAETRAQLQADLQRVWELRKKTVLFVTHEIAEAIALGSRILVLKRAPAEIIADIPVDLPRPRVVDEVLTSPQFTIVYDTIRKLIR